MQNYDKLKLERIQLHVAIDSLKHQKITASVPSTKSSQTEEKRYHLDRKIWESIELQSEDSYYTD